MAKETCALGETDPNVPADWDYNPSSWPERLPLVGVALVGFGIAAYLSAYQTGLIRSVWDPFFGSASSERILTSSLWWPRNGTTHAGRDGQP